jgi:hypothetical protein
MRTARTTFSPVMDSSHADAPAAHAPARTRSARAAVAASLGDPFSTLLITVRVTKGCANTAALASKVIT